MKTNIRRVLAAIDLSAHSEAVVCRAAEVALAMQCPLTLFHVVDDRVQDDDEAIGETAEISRRLAGKEMAELGDGFRSLGIELNYETANGVPWQEIVRKVEDDGYDLLIAGRRPRNRFNNRLSKGTPERLLDRCPCPLWIVQNSPTTPIRRVLAAVDFSPVSGLALEAAAAFAVATAATLSVLHVIKSDPLFTKLAAIRAGAIMRAARDRARRLRSHARLEDFIEQHVPGAIYALEKMASGNLITQLQKTIQFQLIDLLVIGTGDRRGRAGQFRSDTVKQLLGKASCDILAVRTGSRFTQRSNERVEPAAAVQFDI